MTPVHVTCPVCRGEGHAAASARSPWPLCPTCDGIGHVWAPGAPSYGCQGALADRTPGDMVVLGNGDSGRVLRHSSKIGTPTTWLGLVGEFSGLETDAPIAYPSSVGVAEVLLSRARGERQGRARAVDIGDPMQRSFENSPNQGR